MDYTVTAYSIYLLLSITLTIWVAYTIHKNGKIFLTDICHGQNELAKAINKLLQMGFYLLSLGYAIVWLKISDTMLNSSQTLVETLSSKIGNFILILGLLLFTNFFILLLIRGGAKKQA